jgi:predicted  nucleic acid-binding Zn-ribbon protein
VQELEGEVNKLRADLTRSDSERVSLEASLMTERSRIRDFVTELGLRDAKVSELVSELALKETIISEQKERFQKETADYVAQVQCS